jgi:hypothetical protein
MEAKSKSWKDLILASFIDFQNHGKRKENRFLMYFIAQKDADRRTLLKNPEFFINNPKMRNYIYYKRKLDLSKYQLKIILNVTDMSCIPIIRLAFDRGYIGVVVSNHHKK